MWVSERAVRSCLPVLNVSTERNLSGPPVAPPQVEDLQRRYEAAVRDLFDRYKGRAGYSKVETLVII